MPPPNLLPARRLARLLFALGLGSFTTPVHAQINSTNQVYAHRAEKAFLAAGLNYATAPDTATNCWQLGRTAFDWCQFATNDIQRADVAKAGITAGQRLTAADPKSAVGHYYLAMDYGELAEAEAPSLAAYRLVKEIEREFQIALKLDPHLDFAGPDRNLGLLYRDAPGWPISIGNKWRAYDHLQAAATNAPDYPENLLNLAESQIKWRMTDDAQKTLHDLDVRWPASQTNFTGEAWQESWEDWIARRAAAKTEFVRVFRHAP